MDSIGRVGIDRGWIGVFATAASDWNGLDIAVENDHAIAFGLNVETDECAGG
jgi:hypothetical protein